MQNNDREQKIGKVDPCYRTSNLVRLNINIERSHSDICPFQRLRFLGTFD